MESTRDGALSHNDRGIPSKKKGFFLHRQQDERELWFIHLALPSMTFSYQSSLCVCSITSPVGLWVHR